MVLWLASRVLASRYGLFNHGLEAAPLGVSKKLLEITRQPVLDARLALFVHQVLKARMKPRNDFLIHRSTPFLPNVLIAVSWQISANKRLSAA
jgi:hypothetical protein